MQLEREIEAKFLDIDIEQLRATLQKVGAKLITPERMMTRVVFDPPATDGLKNTWGRVRDEGNGKITLSIKQVVDPTKVDGTQEHQEVVGSVEAGIAKLKEKGFRQKAFQESTRETWQYEGCSIDIDRWPGLKYWVEIEAHSEEEIAAAAKVLNVDGHEKMYASADYVYEKVYGIAPAVINMLPEIVFSNEGMFAELAKGQENS